MANTKKILAVQHTYYPWLVEDNDWAYVRNNVPILLWAHTFILENTFFSIIIYGWPCNSWIILLGLTLTRLY